MEANILALGLMGIIIAVLIFACRRYHKKYLVEKQKRREQADKIRKLEWDLGQAEWQINAATKDKNLEYPGH